MSSKMKDARWELAYNKLTSAFGVDWAYLEYPEQQTLLDAAQVLLNHLDESEVAELASEFRGNSACA